MTRPPTNTNNDAKGISELVEEVRRAISRVVYPMVGPRCKTKDWHDFPDLKGKERCLVCATYDEVDSATSAILKALHKAMPRKVPINHDTKHGGLHKTCFVCLRAEGYNKAIDQFNALLQPYKLRKPK